MLIVAAQVHIWSSRTPTNPNHRQIVRPPQPEPFGRGLRAVWPRSAGRPHSAKSANRTSLGQADPRAAWVDQHPDGHVAGGTGAGKRSGMRGRKGRGEHSRPHCDALLGQAVRLTVRREQLEARMMALSIASGQLTSYFGDLDANLPQHRHQVAYPRPRPAPDHAGLTCLDVRSLKQEGASRD